MRTLTKKQQREYIAAMSGRTLGRMTPELWRLTDEDLELLRDAVAAEQQPSARARSAAKREERAR